VYACFADLKGAFDNVDPTTLLQSLKAAGLPDPTVALIANLYDGAVARLFDNGVLDKTPIPICRGIRQGCPLSPTLFNIFTTIIAQHLASYQPTVQPDGYTTHNSMLYADDTTVVAHSAADLQVLLDMLHDVCTRLHMTIDPGKTVIMIFDSTSPGSSHPFTIGSTPIRCVQHHKYLGLHLDNTLSASTMRSKRLATATAMLQKAFDFAARADLHHMQSLTSLLSATVVQTALYGVEVWGLTELLTMDTFTNDVQTLMARFLKRALHLPTHTSTIVLHLESGQKSAFTYCMRRCTAFVHRCSIGPDPLLHSMVADLRFMTSWNQLVVRILNSPSPQHPPGQQDTQHTRHRLPTSRSGRDSIHTLTQAAVMCKLQDLYRKDLAPYLADTPYNAQAEHRTTSTYVRDIWHGKFAISSHTRHAFYSATDVTRPAYKAWLRTRTLTLGLPAYRDLDANAQSSYLRRTCIYACNAPGDLKHLTLQCVPILSEIRHMFPGITYPPASLQDLFNTAYEPLLLSKIILAVYRLLLQSVTYL